MGFVQSDGHGGEPRAVSFTDIGGPVHPDQGKQDLVRWTDLSVSATTDAQARRRDLFPLGAGMGEDTRQNTQRGDRRQYRAAGADRYLARNHRALRRVLAS